MVQSISLSKLREDADYIFHNGFACSESVIYAIRKNFELEMSDDAFAMSTGFPWGLGGIGCICGAVAGGAMCIGFVFGRRTPGDPCAANCHKLTKEFGQAIKDKFGATCCGKLISNYGDLNSPGRKAHCSDIVDFATAKVAEIICRELDIKIED